MMNYVGCEAGIGGRMKFYRNWMRVALMAVAALAALSCSNEFTRSSSPVLLLVTNTQNVQRVDLAGNGSSGNTNCNLDIGTINITARLKNPDANTQQGFNDVRITRYRVSYRRIDGGTLVPAPFVRPIDILVTANGASALLSKFQVFSSDAIFQAPFVSLFPSNGGRDPETGKAVVSLEVVLEVFGQTIAGTNVSATTTFPLDFCISCNGCA
jgi:hypothetical protein